MRDRSGPSPVQSVSIWDRSDPVQTFLGLDLDWTGRFQSGLIHCWTGGIIDEMSPLLGQSLLRNIAILSYGFADVWLETS